MKNIVITVVASKYNPPIEEFDGEYHLIKISNDKTKKSVCLPVSVNANIKDHNFVLFFTESLLKVFDEVNE